MRIEGVYTYTAPRELVWSLLLDPNILKQSLPGCEEFDQITNTEYIAALQIQMGPFKGSYRGRVKRIDDGVHNEYGLTLEGEGPDGPVMASGTLALTAEDASTIIHYEGDVDFAGHTAAESPRMLRTTANALIRQFFEALDRQVKIQTGIHTTSLPGQRPQARRSGTIDVQDAIAEIKQDRRTRRLVLALIALAILMFSGPVVILVLLIRWGKRIFDRRVAAAIQANQQAIHPLERP